MKRGIRRVLLMASAAAALGACAAPTGRKDNDVHVAIGARSEEHTSELQSQ